MVTFFFSSAKQIHIFVMVALTNNYYYLLFCYIELKWKKGGPVRQKRTEAV